MKLVNGSDPKQRKGGPAQTLINTKLDIPPLKAKMLQRKELLDHLLKGKDSRLILISGEAGSGKTSLACQWLEQENLSAAWYTLDADDNNPDLCLRYLLTTLSRRDSSLDAVIYSWQQSQQAFSIREIAPVLVQHYLNAQDDLYLVLDDYHLINNDTVHEAVSYLLTHLPPRLHVVILTRHSLPFSIAPLRMRGQMIEINAGNMRLSVQETQQFFTDIMPCNLSEQQLEEVFRKTEGWIGGLQLFGLALRNNASRPEGINDVHPISQWTMDYLIHEVVEVQREEVRNFILKTSLLDRFNADICRELTGCDNAREILDYIYWNNLFLVALDHEGEWYRYHHLLSEAVRRRSLRDSIEAVHAVQRKAAVWFARNGWTEDALRHAFATGDSEFAADIFEDLVPIFWDRYELISSQRWLNRIPKEIERERALLMFHECNLFLEAMQLIKAKAVLDDIENRRDHLFARYTGDKRRACEDSLRLLRGFLVFFKDPLQADRSEMEKLYQELAPRKSSAVALKIMMSASYMLKGEMRQAVDTLQDLKDLEGITSSTIIPYHVMHWFRLLATAEIQRGRLRHAERLIEDALTYLERKGLSRTPLRYMISVAKAWLYYHRNDFDKAEKLVAEGFAYAEAADHHYVFLDAGFLTANIHLSRGRLDEAEKVLYKVLEAATPNSDEQLLFETLLIYVSAIRHHRKGTTYRPDAESNLIYPDKPSSLFGFAACLIHAYLLYLQKRFQESIAVLDSLRESCVAGDMGDYVLRIDICSSAIHYAMGDTAQARQVMEQALVFAEREGYVWPFVYHAQSIAPILKQIAENPVESVSPHFFATLLTSCGIAGNMSEADDKQNGNGHNRLTERELEMLNFIVQGYKNKEIAEKTFVSLHTVKTHLKHIFEKLHVETRIQAIRRAEELKLLDNLHPSSGNATALSDPEGISS